VTSITDVSGPNIGSRRALRRIRGIDREDMLVNMIPMHVVEMAVMYIVDVTIVADRSVAAVRSALMGMVGMTLSLQRRLISISCLFVREPETDLIFISAAHPSAPCTKGDMLGLFTSKFDAGDEPSRFIRI
jgi:hypothetical protein